MTQFPQDQSGAAPVDLGGGLINRIVSGVLNQNQASKNAQAQARATKAYLEQNAQSMGMDPDTIDRFTQQGPDEGARAYNTRLNGYIQNVIAGQQAKTGQANQAYLGSEAMKNAAQAQLIQRQLGMMDAAKARMAQGQQGQAPAPGQPQAQGPAQPQSPAPQNLSPYLQQVPQGQTQAPGNAMLNQLIGTRGSIATPLNAGGTGRTATPPAPGVRINPPAPIDINDPRGQPIYDQALMSGATLDQANDARQKWVDTQNTAAQTAYNQRTQVTQPTNRAHFLKYNYQGGVPTEAVFAPLIKKGPGTAAESEMEDQSKTVTLPYGTDPRSVGLNVVSGSDDKPLGGLPAAPYNTNDPAWVKDQKDAFDQSQAAATSLGNTRLLWQAAQAYTAGDMSQYNSIMGRPEVAALVQNVTGKNPVAMLQSAMARNTQAILGQIRGPNGSVGGRILQAEYENAAQMLGSPTADKPTILAAARNAYTMADRLNTISSDFADLRSRMPESQALSQIRAKYKSLPKLYSPYETVKVGTGTQTGSIPWYNMDAALKRPGTRLLPQSEQ